MRLRTTILLLAVVAATTPAAPSEPEKIDLFLAGQGGYALYRIPGLVVTSKGTVLAYCEGRKGKGDWAQIDVFLRRSTDGGRSFSPPIQIAHHGPPVPKNPVAVATKVA